MKVYLHNIAQGLSQVDPANAKVGRKLYSDALLTVNEPAATYLQMMQYNVDTIVAALAP